MANTYTQIYLHLVFAVRHRDRILPLEHKTDLQKYITGIITENGVKLIAINNVSDHIHILIGMNPAIALSDLVRDIKASSSNFLNGKGWIPGKFAWQEGYGAFSHGRSQIDGVVKYILDQENHHRKKTFREEYLNTLKRFEISYDQKYLFEFFD